MMGDKGERVMAKVTLENGLVVDALVLIQSNLRDYMVEARRLVSEAEEHGTQEHRNAVVRLSNCLSFLAEAVAHLPTRKYKQPRPMAPNFP